ncbi:MAG TPA: hypothetical protein VN247_06940 [Arenimonas sp.]|nr:hypothetical protein [Arenimonas sp.]
MKLKVFSLLACVFMLGCKSTPTVDSTTATKATVETTTTSTNALTSKPKEIAISASSNFYAYISTGGLTAAITEIKSCYDGVKERDNFLFCMSMDIQGQRFNDTMSKRTGVPGDAYFEQDYLDERLMVLERWYPSKSQLDYTLKQVMAGLEQGTKNEVMRIEQLQKK